MRVVSALIIVATAVLPMPAHAWGKTGHRVVGAIAEPYLSSRARSGVERILGRETLAEASTWADFMRSDPSPFWQRTATPWHYVTIAPGKTYGQTGAPPEGDAITALHRYSAMVRDPRASHADKQIALRFIIHLVGDLHQPLHAGNGSDRGGNDLKLTFMGQPTNLHALWDSGLIDEEQLSFTEMASWLTHRLSPASARAAMTTDVHLWIAESAALRDRIYPAPGERSLGYAYVYRHQRELEGRLTLGGVRLAAYLNELFARGTPARRSPRQPS